MKMPVFNVQNFSFSTEMIEYCLSTLTPEARYFVLENSGQGKAMLGGFRLTPENCAKQVVISRFNQDFRKSRLLHQGYIKTFFISNCMLAYKAFFEKLGEGAVLGSWRALMSIVAEPRVFALAIIAEYLMSGRFARLGQLLMRCRTFWSKDNSKDARLDYGFYLAMSSPFDSDIEACIGLYKEGDVLQKLKERSNAAPAVPDSRLEEANNKIAELKTQMSKMERDMANMQREMQASQENARNVVQNCEARLKTQRDEIGKLLEESTWRATAALAGINVDWLHKVNAEHNCNR